MANVAKIDSILAEKIKNNNIELARELTKRKQKITEIKIELQEIQYHLLDTERQLKVANMGMQSRNTEIRALKLHNQKLQTELKECDDKLAEWRQLFVGTFVAATEKYRNIIQTIGVSVSTIKMDALSSDEMNDMPSEESDAEEYSIGSIKHEDDDVSMEDSRPSSLYPHVMVVSKSDQPEFSDDSVAELSFILQQFSNTSLNSVAGQNDNDTKNEPIHKSEAVSIPSISITMCDDSNDASKANKVPKRKKSDSFLQVPKRSFGNRKSEPHTAFNSKSPTKSESSTPKFKPRSTSLNKIVETSPAKSPKINSITSEQQSNSSIHDDSQILSGSISNNNSNNNRSNDSGFAVLNCSKSPIRSISPVGSPNQLITSISSPNPSPQFTNRKNVQSHSTVSHACSPENNFSKTNNDQRKKINVLPVSPTSHVPVHSTKNQSNGIDPKKSESINATVAGPNDCIARHRTKRRAAPRDLKDPFPLMKNKRTKF